MKKTYKDIFKNTIISLSLALSLSSCGIAQNMMGEMHSYSDSIKQQVKTTTVEKTEVSTTEETAVSVSEKNETSNVAYLAEAKVENEPSDKANENEENTEDSSKEEAEVENAEETSEEATEEIEAKNPNLDAEKNESKDSANDQISPADEVGAIEKQADSLEESAETPDQLEASVAQNQENRTPISNENANTESIPLEVVRYDIVAYRVEVNGLVKEYANNQEGLNLLIADANQELDHNHNLEANLKEDIKNHLKTLNTVEEAIYYMAEIRAGNIKISAQKTPANNQEITYELVEVINVLDGDTIEILVNGEKKQVNLRALATPEIEKADKKGQYFSKESFAFTKESLTGKKFFMEKENKSPDSDNQIILWITAPANPTNPTYEELRVQSFNGILVSEGYANATSKDDKYKAYFEKMQEEALKANKGMWK